MAETNHFETTNELSDVHHVLLEMMKITVGIFEKHHLRYALYCGTLLGAIRHKGFVPWDDDVDIVMPLEDYRKFLRIASTELPEGYTLQTPFNSRTHLFSWLRIYKDGTTMLKRSQFAVDTTWGMFIDVYPMIGQWPVACLRSLQVKLIMFAKGLLLMDFYRVTGNYGNNLVRIKKLLQCLPAPFHRFFARLFLRLTMWPMDKSKRVSSIDLAPFSFKYDRSWWKETVKSDFEDTHFNVPAEYDKILTLIYGDYMTPPPEKNRFGHGAEKGDMIYDVNRDYREYREELLRSQGS